MKKRNLWAIAFLAFPCLCAMGEDVYVYSDAAGEPVQAFTGIRKITFSENAMQVMAADGTSSEVLFTDFHYFTFVEKENSGIAASEVSGAVVFLGNGNHLSVASDKVINRIEMFSASGNKVVDDAPLSCEYDQSIETCPAGLYIVKVTLGDKQEFHKIIKK